MDTSAGALDKKIAVLYHADCPDGFAAAWSAWKKFGNEAIYLPVYHQTPPPEWLANKTVYFLDYSYPEAEMKKLSARAKELILIDHHITNKPISDFVAGVFDQSHSGSALAWRYFHPSVPVPKLIDNIEDIDLWKFSLTDSAAVVEDVMSYPLEFEKFSQMADAFETDAGKDAIITEGMAIMRKDNLVISKLAKHATEVIFEGIKCLAVNSPVLTSFIGDTLVKSFPPIAIIWSRRGNKIIVSLRSNGDADVAAIAEKYGGGGHPKASGFSFELKNPDPQFPWKICD